MDSVHDSLADNFNTSLAIQHISGLVKKTNIYINETKNPRAYVLNAVASYITHIFKVRTFYKS
jgi:cysteinyl-tRNA synthetase